MRTPLDLPLVQFDDKFVVLVDGPLIWPSCRHLKGVVSWVNVPVIRFPVTLFFQAIWILYATFLSGLKPLRIARDGDGLYSIHDGQHRQNAGLARQKDDD